MKLWKKISLFLVLFLAAERFCRSQTEGFRIGKTLSDYPYQKKWEIAFSTEQEENVQKLLAQPFHFLGSGVQSYAFLGEDGETVLKIFKPFHMWPPNHILKQLPLPSGTKNKIVSDRNRRVEAIFQSAKIAYENLKEKTALVYLHLNTTKEKFTPITLYDKLGIKHTASLDQSAFALQKKAELMLPYFKEHPDEGKQIIGQLFELIILRCKKGIANSDPVFHKNFGLSEGKVVEIDIGSFSFNPFLQKTHLIKKEILYETLTLKTVLEEQFPELLEYYNEHLKKVIEASDF